MKKKPIKPIDKDSKLYRYITTAEDIKAEEYDGTYILLPAVVKAFKSVDVNDLNVADLDAIYLSTIGTWKVSYNVKKQRIKDSHLPEEKKRELVKLINDLSERAKTEFHHDDNIGMFGTGFMSFSKSFKDEASLADLRSFITMLIKISETDDENEMFDIVSDVTERHIYGIGVGTLSILLHTLRPCVFPVLNGRQGTGASVYTKLGIQLDNPGSVETYIKNVKAIKDFRDKERCKFKNYRVMDMVSNDLLENEEEDNGELNVSSMTTSEVKKSYSHNDFLNEVFMSKEEYNELYALLDNKKNLILQGAPGVGKTFAAKRLAYSIMGDKNDDRIEFVQFHQNYSYEDFIMGYKPNGEGFELREGVFYRFCKKAASDTSKNEYFFIIDEINRGNMSKIFGELLMLIEKDYRGKKHAIRLAYQGENDEKFYVPENLYIIGMMNTADRSLAMIDYALRRRFGFHEMKPAFGRVEFKNYCERIGLKDNNIFEKLLSTITGLNAEIIKDPSLGDGFCIGHSYFCIGDEKSDENPDTLDSRLQAVVKYDIVPTLKEYWFDTPDKFDKWKKDLYEAVKIKYEKPAESRETESGANQ